MGITAICCMDPQTQWRLVRLLGSCTIASEGPKCSPRTDPGDSVTVKKQKLSVNIPPNDAIAIHVPEKPAQAQTEKQTQSTPSSSHNSAQTVTAIFSVEADTDWGENVYLVGSVPELGGWDPVKAVSTSGVGGTHSDSDSCRPP